jgi:RimJ/RimL family protein N-acetyltransferase
MSNVPPPSSSTRVRLAPVVTDHIRVFHRWFYASRPETQTCRPVVSRSADEAIEAYRKRPLTGFEQDFAVLRTADDCLVGRIRYFDVNVRNRSAEVGYVIGPEFQGQGYATEALGLLLHLLFRERHLNKVYAQTAEFNAPSIALLKHWGFHQDGRLRQHHELDGTFHDDLIFSLLADEYDRITFKSKRT